MKNVRSKVCKCCNFSGKVNAEEKCASCAEKVSEEVCGVCCREVGSKEKGLFCDLCQRWQHALCEKVNNKLYEALQDVNDLPWACTKCMAQAKRATESVRKTKEEKENLVKEQLRLDDEVKALRECLGAVERENRSLREKVRDLERDQVREAKGGESVLGESAGEASGPVGVATAGKPPLVELGEAGAAVDSTERAVRPALQATQDLKWR